MSYAGALTTTKKRNILYLTLTEQCNLACVYCYERNKSLTRMPVELAKSAIVDAFENNDFEEVEINYFGGEPFVAFSELQTICEWLWGRTWPKPYICFATTNGTLIHGKTKEWVRANHRRLVLGLSFDGTPAMHNMNRSSSFSRIDVGFYKQLWPFQPVKMTLSKLTLPLLAEGIVYLHGIGVAATCNPAYGTNWEESDYNIFADELRKVVKFYIENPHIYPINIATVSLEHMTNVGKEHRWCGAGRSMTCVSMDGKRYPCQMFMPSSAGDGVNIDEAFYKLKKSALIDKRCKRCPIASICPTCYGSNLGETGDIATRNAHHCAFSKIRAKGTAYMLSHMLTNSGRGYVYLQDKSDSEIQRMIRGIMKINHAGWAC